MANNQQLLLGEGAGGGIPNYIEDVFSTYLYTGNGSTQTITNNIDLSTKGGMVWFKSRSAATNHRIFDTVRGRAAAITPDTTAGAGASSAADRDLISFDATGFSLGIPSNYDLNTSSRTYVSWTFREQPKFFDVVTYTGDGTSNRAISHSLTSTPGCIIVKRTDATSAWYVYHRAVDALPSLYYTVLNTDAPRAGAPAVWDVAPTSANFTVQPSINVSAGTYVAYLFAHDAGGFGASGTDNVISCGSFTADGSGGATVNLGYEPQWVMWKRSDGTGDWTLLDNMRGWGQAIAQRLVANTSAAEDSMSGGVGFTPFPTATGFFNGNQGAAFATYIYIAIRRGPMKVPTSGTSVFSPLARSGANSGSRVFTGIGFPPDLVFNRGRTSASDSTTVVDRLRGGGSTVGVTPVLRTALTNAEGTIGGLDFSNNMDGFLLFDDGQANWSNSAYTYINWNFRRAPGFFDEVCYTSDGTYNPISHNLTVVPELVILKIRDGAGDWYVYNGTQYGYLNTTAAFANFSRTLTTTTFVPITQSGGNKFVTYLFATVAGVSKVGSYTGNGSNQTINCGFTAGSRFVLIKRTDSTGDWYVWDSARGIVAGNDPHLSLNTTAAEVTTDDSVDTDNSGFIVNQVAATNVNVTSATYIFLAIA